MAGSDFEVFLGFIARAAGGLAALSRDLLAGALLLGAAGLPWRLLELLRAFRFHDDWQCDAVLSFMLTLVDLVVAPMTLLSLISPFRWRRVYLAFKRYDKDSPWEIRCDLSFGIFLVPLDLLCFIGFLIQHVIPMRLHLLYRRLGEHWRASSSNFDYYGSERTEVALFVVGQTCVAVLDTLCCVIGGIACLATPSLWYCTWRGVCLLFSTPSTSTTTFTTVGTPASSSRWQQNDWEDAFNTLRVLMLSRVIYMFVDWCCYLLSLFALLSPFRHLAFRRSMYNSGLTICGFGLGTCCERPNSESFQRKRSEPKEVYNDFSYNANLRWNCVYYGSTAVVDVLLFPIMLPLLLTWYRYNPLRRKLFYYNDDGKNVSSPSTPEDESGEEQTHEKYTTAENTQTVPIKQWGFHEYAIIGRQFSLLMFDFLFSPLFLIVFITRYRYDPVRRVMASDDLSSWHSCYVYLALISSSLYIILDIVTFPLLLVIVITYYRLGPSQTIWQVKPLWYGYDDAALWFHISVLVNFIVILHDCLLLPIVVCVLTLTGIRTSRTCRILKSTGYQTCLSFGDTSNEPSVQENSNAQNVDAEDFTSTTNQNEQIYSQVSIHAVVEVGDPVVALDSNSGLQEASNSHQMLQQHTPNKKLHSVPPLLPSSSWRMGLWIEFINLFFDIPFVVLSVIIYCSLWRARKLYESLRKVEEENPENDHFIIDNNDCCDEDDDCFCCCCVCMLCSRFCWSNNRRNWHSREAVLKQFGYLLRDILLLVPMSVIICTLYRLPKFIMDLVSKFSPINAASPAFRATDVQVDCADTVGPVNITITCHRLSNNATDLENNSPAIVSYASPVKLFLSGDEFWTAVGNTFGDNAMRIGQALLPKVLTQGDEVGYGVLETIDHQNSPDEGYSRCYRIKIKLKVGNTKRTTILKKLRTLDQNVRFILQVEAAVPRSENMDLASLSPVVVSLTPKVSDLTNIFDQQTIKFPVEACDEFGTFRADILTADKPATGIVDELWIVVLLHFTEIVLDLAHLVLALFTVVMPWRAMQLLIAVSESDRCATWREAQELHESYCYAKECLMEYRAGMAPLMNSLSKQPETVARSLHSRYSWYGYYDSPAVTNRLKDLEKYTWKEYKHFISQILKRAEKSNLEAIQGLGAKIKASADVEEIRLQHWATRTVFNTMSPSQKHDWKIIANIPQSNDNDLTGLLVQVVDESSLRMSKAQGERDMEVTEHMSLIRDSMLQERICGTQTWRNRWGGIWRRSSSVLRKLVQRHAKLAIQDMGYIFTLIVVFFTMVRTLPLAVELWHHGSLWLTSSGPRRILLKHLKGTGRDLKRLGKFLFFSLCVLLLGVGVPSFFRKLPSRFRSLEDATLCAQEHLNDTLKYFCELLFLVTAWKVYKMLISALLYAVLVPPACLAEAAPKRMSTVQARFIFGIVVWFGLAVGAFMLTMQTDSASSEESVRTNFFCLFGALVLVVACAVLSLQKRSKFRNPIVESSTGFFSFSWTHIFALLLGPIESLQLTSVILYFFWNDDSFGGNFTFPVVFAFDTPDKEQFFDYTLAMGLATCFVYVWVVIVSLPLIFNSENVEERVKMRNLQRSPLFDTFHVLISRLLFVSIVATLLRPFSCQLLDSDLVLTTDHDVLCGGHESFFSGSASSVLLIFFVITTTVLHADSPDLMTTPDHVTNGESSDSVRFAPLYSLVIQLGQLILCVLCLGLPGQSSGGKRATLLCIAIGALALVLWCLLYPWRSCSLACVGPVRSAGFGVVFFASMLCYIRDTNALTAGSHWRDQTVLFPVAAAIFGLGYCYGVMIQRKANRKWKVMLQAAGLGAAIESIAALRESLLVHEALGGGIEGGRRRSAKLLAQACECRSAPALGLLLVRFEEQILAERLNYEFLISRKEWRDQLLGIPPSATGGSNVHSSDIVSYGHITRGASALQSAIRPIPPLAVVNKHLIAMVFINHLPEYVAWEVFGYMHNINPLVKALKPLLENTQNNVWGSVYALGLLSSVRQAESTLRSSLHPLK